MIMHLFILESCNGKRKRNVKKSNLIPIRLM